MANQRKKMSLSPTVIQSGMIIPIAAGAMLMIAGVTAFAVDIGYQRVVDNELQNIADTAALAGAAATKSALVPEWAQGCAAAKSALTLNKAATKTLNTGNGSKDFTLMTGYATPDGNEFEFTPHAQNQNGCAGLVPPALAPNQFPAIAVVAKRTNDSTSGGITSFFAKVFGLQTLGATSETSVAMIGAPSTVPGSAAFPIAMSFCAYEKHWDKATGLPKDEDNGDGFSDVPISLFSAQLEKDKPGGGPKKGGKPGDPPEEEECVDEMQWSTLDPTEKNIDLAGDVSETDIKLDNCGGSPNSASKVACMINGKLPIPDLENESDIMINIQNGKRSKLFDEAKIAVGKIVMVPVVDIAALTHGNNEVTEVVDFVPVKIVSSDKNTSSISVRFVSLHKLAEARPGTGTPISGAVTRAFLIN